jgi:hypothetical protein
MKLSQALDFILEQNSISGEIITKETQLRIECTLEYDCVVFVRCMPMS